MNKLLLTQQAITYFQEPITVFRHVTGPGVGQWDSDTGEFIRNQADEIAMNATVVNLSHKDLMQVPEAERTEGMVAIYTLTPVYTTDEPGQQYSDLVQHDGIMYRVVKSYSRRQGEFYKCIGGKYRVQTDDGVPT